MAKFNDRTGESRTMKSGLTATVSRYRNNSDVDIEFQNGEKVYNRHYGDFVRGQVQCPMIIEIIAGYAKVANPNSKPEVTWIMDIEDLPLLGNSSWCKDNAGYIIGTINNTRVRLHTIIMGQKPGMRVDHRDGNTLDCRKSNLRHCTHAENNRNQSLRRTSRTGYKGVSYHEKSGKWYARIGHNGRSIRLGVRDTAEQAAQAYNDAAILYFGEFARLNIIP